VGIRDPTGYYLGIRISLGAMAANSVNEQFNEQK
jgi:hypothetical protein